MLFALGEDAAATNNGRITATGASSVGIEGVITNTNTGTVRIDGDESFGMQGVGDGHELTNTGRIITDGGAFDSDTVGVLRAAGVVVAGDAVKVQNSGTIRSKDAASAAVELNIVEQEGLPADSLSSQLDNAGRISAPGVAVLGGAGQETVVNRGRVVGDVSLGDGDDSFTSAMAAVSTARSHSAAATT